MDLVIKDELSGKATRTLLGRFRLRRLGGGDVEQRAEDVVERDKSRRHAAAGAQEMPAVKAEPFAVRRGEILQPRLELPLPCALRQRIELAVRDHAGWDRRRKRRRLH